MWNGPRPQFEKRRNVWNEEGCPQNWKKLASVWKRPAFGKKLPAAIDHKVSVIRRVD
jgi:hypothetical protein